MTDKINEKDIIEHTIHIDKYMTVVLKIPKVLNAMEFAGLIEKSKKLLNVATITTNENKVEYESSVVKNPKKDNDKVFTVEIINEIKDCLKNSKYSYPSLSKRINTRFGVIIDRKLIQNKVNSLRKNGEW